MTGVLEEPEKEDSDDNVDEAPEQTAEKIAVFDYKALKSEVNKLKKDDLQTAIKADGISGGTRLNAAPWPAASAGGAYHGNGITWKLSFRVIRVPNANVMAAANACGARFGLRQRGLRLL